MIWLTLSPVVVLLLMPSHSFVPLEWLSIMAAISSFSMLLNAFNWLRLFDGTSFYILLLRETISDI